MLAILLVGPAFAQFKGIVTDAKQRPLKGIKVWKKNSTESVHTSPLGAFLFEQLLPADTLVIAVSKREEAVIPVGQYKEILIILDKKEFRIQDGQQEQKREYSKVYRAPRSSNVVTREQIAKMSVSDLYDILRGALPGVTVTDGSRGQIVTIRGGNSFELDTEPLFILDGTQYESSADVNQQITVSDIERIEVQKEGSGYGMKGSNGVIIITTSGNR